VTFNKQSINTHKQGLFIKDQDQEQDLVCQGPGLHY